MKNVFSKIFGRTKLFNTGTIKVVIEFSSDRRFLIKTSEKSKRKLRVSIRT